MLIVQNTDVISVPPHIANSLNDVEILLIGVGGFFFTIFLIVICSSIIACCFIPTCPCYYKTLPEICCWCKKTYYTVLHELPETVTILPDLFLLLLQHMIHQLIMIQYHKQNITLMNLHAPPYTKF